MTFTNAMCFIPQQKDTTIMLIFPRRASEVILLICNDTRAFRRNKKWFDETSITDSMKHPFFSETAFNEVALDEMPPNPSGTIIPSIIRNCLRRRRQLGWSVRCAEWWTKRKRNASQSCFYFVRGLIWSYDRRRSQNGGKIAENHNAVITDGYLNLPEQVFGSTQPAFGC